MSGHYHARVDWRAHYGNCAFVVDPVSYERIFFLLVLYSLFTDSVKFITESVKYLPKYIFIISYFVGLIDNKRSKGLATITTGEMLLRNNKHQIKASI